MIRDHADYRLRVDEEIQEFRALFPLVDLDQVPEGTWRFIPGARCTGVALCPGKHNSPTCQFRHRAHLFTAQAGICGLCDRKLPANLTGSDIDHVIPRSRRGPDEDWNRRLLHAGCNSAKGARLTDEAYDLADARGFAIPDFIAALEQPVDLAAGRRSPGYNPYPGRRRTRWQPSGGPVHLLVPGRLSNEAKTLCGYGKAWGWPRVYGDSGKPWNVTCDSCRERRVELGPGTGPAYPWLPY